MAKWEYREHVEVSDATGKSERVRKGQSQGSKFGSGLLTSPTLTASKNNIFVASSGELCAGTVVDPFKMYTVRS